MTDLIHDSVSVIFYLVSLVGICIVSWGVGEAVWRFFALKFRRDISHAQMVARTARIRERLGAHLLLALDMFIGADIIKSVVAPAWENIGMLGAIVLIRIVMSYFLEKEMERTHESAQSGRLASAHEAESSQQTPAEPSSEKN